MLFEEQTTADSALYAGVSQPDTGGEAAAPDDDLTETRYVINPYAVCDVRALPHPLGYQFLPSGTFIKIKAVSVTQAVADYTYTPQSPFNKGGNYEKIFRQPGQILNDIVLIYSGDGVTEIKALRGIDDDNFTNNLSKLLLGTNVPAKTDVFDEDHPCPNMPAWFEQIEANYQAIMQQNAGNAEMAERVRNVYKDVQSAFRTALAQVRTITGEALSRMLDPTNKNKTFSVPERRAFLAQGEEIPDQMPTTTRSANSRGELFEETLLGLVKNQNDSAQNTQLTLMNNQMAQMLEKIESQEREMATLRAVKRIEQEEVRALCADLTKSGEPCKAYAMKDSEFCSVHSKLAAEVGAAV